MMDSVFLLKWLHIVSSTLLFGTGLGTAFFMVAAHYSRSVAAIASVSRFVVIADWLFTLIPGIIQPISGLLLMKAMGYNLTDTWIVWALALYGLALLCWLPVVWLQINMRDLANEALSTGADLPPRYFKFFRIWFALGWPAFAAMLTIFYLMVAKPV